MVDDFIRHEQFRFYHVHSTTLQRVRVIAQLPKTVGLYLSTGADQMDVSKALDKVWHKGFVYKLDLFQLPLSLLHFLRTYLSYRIFNVNVDGFYSGARRVSADVPQGSVLVIVLHLLYTKDLPVYRAICCLTFSLFTDETMIHYSTLIPRSGSVMLKRELNIHLDWLQRWGMAISTEKSQAVCFCAGIRPFGNQSPLKGDP